METIKRSSGISLLEVLAAIFVLSIGLLGVLAVIPFGAYQVSKAQHAEYAANMLANAAEEVIIRKMADPTEWTAVDTKIQSGDILVFERNDPPEASTLNCTRFIWYEPFDVYDPEYHIVCVSTFIDEKRWDEVMRGQDDLVYSTYADKRPDFVSRGGKIQSSGKYTWFFTYLPATNIVSKDAVRLSDVDKTVTVDVLACYNRVPSDDRQVQPNDFMPSRNGGTFTLPNADHSELLTQTKYVFVTWETPQGLGGAWCKIVFVDRSTPLQPKIIVTGSLPDLNKQDGEEAIYDNVQIYIPSGVLYHKRVEDVPIK